MEQSAENIDQIAAMTPPTISINAQTPNDASPSTAAASTPTRTGPTTNISAFPSATNNGPASAQIEATNDSLTEAHASTNVPAQTRQPGTAPRWYTESEPFDYLLPNNGIELIHTQHEVPSEVLDALFGDVVASIKPRSYPEPLPTSNKYVIVFPARKKALAFHYLRLAAYRNLLDLPARPDSKSDYTLHPEDVDRLVTCGYVSLSEVDFALGAAMLGVGALRRAHREARNEERDRAQWIVPSYERPPSTDSIMAYIKRQEKNRTAFQARLQMEVYTLHPAERPAFAEGWPESRVERYGWYGVKGKKWNDIVLDDDEALEMIKKKDETYYVPTEAERVPPPRRPNPSSIPIRARTHPTVMAPTTSGGPPAAQVARGAIEQGQQRIQAKDANRSNGQGSGPRRKTHTPTKSRRPVRLECTELIAVGGSSATQFLSAHLTRVEPEDRECGPLVKPPVAKVEAMAALDYPPFAPQAYDEEPERPTKIHFAPSSPSGSGKSLRSFDEVPDWYSDMLDWESDDECIGEEEGGPNQSIPEDVAPGAVSNMHEDLSSPEAGPSSSKDKGKRKREDEGSDSSDVGGTANPDVISPPPMKRQVVVSFEPSTDQFTTLPSQTSAPSPLTPGPLPSPICVNTEKRKRDPDDEEVDLDDSQSPCKRMRTPPHSPSLSTSTLPPVDGYPTSVPATPSSSSSTQDDDDEDKTESTAPISRKGIRRAGTKACIRH